MRVKTMAPEAKEHQHEYEGDLRSEDCTLTLAQRFDKAYRDKESYEEAWNFYCSLNKKERERLRSFKSDNGLLDFGAWLERLNKSRPSGVANVWGKLQLICQVNEELNGLAESERPKYLNGLLLTLKL